MLELTIVVYYSVVLGRGKGRGLKSRGTWRNLTDVPSGPPVIPAYCELGELSRPLMSGTGHLSVNCLINFACFLQSCCHFSH